MLANVWQMNTKKARRERVCGVQWCGVRCAVVTLKAKRSARGVWGVRVEEGGVQYSIVYINLFDEPEEYEGEREDSGREALL